jgi:hypothetical protein
MIHEENSNTGREGNETEDSNTATPRLQIFWVCWKKLLTWRVLSQMALRRPAVSKAGIQPNASPEQEAEEAML